MHVENKVFLIIIETITANGASALMPFGNPQNILIYYFFHIHPIAFIYAIAPFTIISLIFILASLYKSKAILHVEREKFNKKAYVYVASFILFVSAILRILPIEIGIIPIIFAIAFDRKSLSTISRFGNIIGSLASLISYRFYKTSFSDCKSYLIKFHIISYLAFFLGIITFFACNL